MPPAPTKKICASGIFEILRCIILRLCIPQFIIFAERLNSLPNKLNTFLYKDIDADGVEISGGEAQKLALARALYKNAPFIILDEPTAEIGRAHV